MGRETKEQKYNKTKSQNCFEIGTLRQTVGIHRHPFLVMDTTPEEWQAHKVCDQESVSPRRKSMSVLSKSDNDTMCLDFLL